MRRGNEKGSVLFMNMIDSHCHLQSLPLQDMGLTMTEVVAKAQQAGVERMLSVSIELQCFRALKKIAEAHASVDISVGVHPSDCHEMTEEQWNELWLNAEHPRVVALGETGLDFYRGDQHKDRQIEAFIRHIEASKKTGKPLIIHTRAAKDETLAVMREHGATNGVMHCFTEDLEMAKAAIDLGFYVSFSGIITFKNAQSMRDVAAALPLDRLLIETDAPYLAPIPYRGKPNQPAWVVHVAEKLAFLHQTTLENVAHQTTLNYRKLFLND